MSFGGSFQTGPDSLYQGADLIRKNEQENLRMQELRRVEEARKQIAADELLNQSTPDVRASWSSGMTMLLMHQHKTDQQFSHHLISHLHSNLLWVV